MNDYSFFVGYLPTHGDNAFWDLKVSDKCLGKPDIDELRKIDPNVGRKGKCNIEGTLTIDSTVSYLSQDELFRTHTSHFEKYPEEYPNIELVQSKVGKLVWGPNCDALFTKCHLRDVNVWRANFKDSTVEGWVDAYDIEATDSTINEIRLSLSVNLFNSTVTKICSCTYLKCENTKVLTPIDSYGVVAIKENSEAVAVKSSKKVLVENSKVASSVEGKNLVALINAEATSVLATNGNVHLSRSKISEDVETDQIVELCENSNIGGKLTCKNKELEIVGSDITMIQMNSPPINIETQDLVEGLRECRDLGMIHLAPNMLCIGRNGEENEITWYAKDFKFRAHGDSSFNNDGTVYLGGDLRFSANNLQHMSESILRVLNEPQPIVTKPLLTRQIITLRDSHVKTLNFARPGGIVILEGTASVDSVLGGEIVQRE